MSDYDFKPILVPVEADIPENAHAGWVYHVKEGPLYVVILPGGDRLKFVGGSGDPNDKGKYPSLAELQSAYPTGRPGNYASVLNATENQIYLWSSVENGWKPSGVTGSYIERINGKTGPNVELGAADVGAAPAEKTVQYSGGNDDVDLTGRGNVILDKASKLLGTDPDGTEHVIGSIQTYDLGGGETLTQNELGNATNHTNINSLDRPTVETTDGVHGLAYDDDKILITQLPMATDADIEEGTPKKIVDARQMKEAIPTDLSGDVYVDTGLVVLAAYEGETTFDVAGPLSAVEGKISVGDRIRIVGDPVKNATITAIEEQSEPPEGETARVYVTIDAAVLTAADNGAVVGRAEAVVELPNYDGEIEVIERHLVTAGYRNALINGGMEIAQRAASFSGTGYGSLDRWRLLKAATMAQSKVIADIQGVSGATAVAKITATATAGMSWAERIENAAMFSGEKATLSFWARASRDMPFNINLTRSAGGTINLSEIAALSTLWQRYKATFDVPLISAAVNPATTYLQLAFDVSPASVGDIVYIGNVQMEAGEVATAFEQRNYKIEKSICERYFERMNCYATATDEYANLPVPLMAWTGSWALEYIFRTAKRVPPTVTIKTNRWNMLRAGQTSLTDTVVTNMAVAWANVHGLALHVAAATAAPLTITYGGGSVSDTATGHLWADAEL